MRDVTWINGLFAQYERKNTLPVLWRRPGCCWRCCQPPCCGQLNCRGWSAEAPPPSLGSAQELAFLLCGQTHTHTDTHNMIWSAQALFFIHNLVRTYQIVCVRVQTHSTHKYTLESTTPRYMQASDTEKWLSMVTRHHHQYTNTHPHMPYGPKRKRLSMFHVGDSANQCHMALRQHTS